MNFSSVRNSLMFNKRELWAVSIASMIRSIGFGMSWPFLAIFLNVELHIPIYIVGLLFTLSTLSSIAFSIIGGGLSDYLGRKTMLLIGSVIGALIYGGLAFLIFHSYPVILVEILFVFSSISGAIVFPAASALVSDVTEESERTMAYSIYRIMSNVGWAIGPLTGAFVYDYGMYIIFIILSITNVLQFIVILFYISRKKKKSSRLRARGNFLVYDKYLFAFSIGTFLVTVLSSQFSVTLPVYSDKAIGIPASSLGYIYAVNGTIVVVGQYPMSWIMRRVSDIKVMMVGSLFYSIGYVLVGFSGTLLDLMIDMVLITIGENFTSPGMNSVVSKIAPSGKTGIYMGFLGMVNSTGRAIGPSLGSVFLFLYAYNGPEVWLSLCSFGLMAIMALSVAGKMIYSRQLNAPEPGTS
jgi:DHA1 family multidrug resistance protein B-like MFS transporter